jgi:hypothetical protein
MLLSCPAFMMLCCGICVWRVYYHSSFSAYKQNPWFMNSQQRPISCIGVHICFSICEFKLLLHLRLFNSSGGLYIICSKVCCFSGTIFLKNSIPCKPELWTSKRILTLTDMINMNTVIPNSLVPYLMQNSNKCNTYFYEVWPNVTIPLRNNHVDLCVHHVSYSVYHGTRCAHINTKSVATQDYFN